MFYPRGCYDKSLNSTISMKIYKIVQSFPASVLVSEPQGLKIQPEWCFHRDKIHQNLTGKMLHVQRRINTPYSIEFAICSAVPSLLREDLYIWILTFCSLKRAVYEQVRCASRTHPIHTRSKLCHFLTPPANIFLVVGVYPFERIQICHVSINLHTQK